MAAVVYAQLFGYPLTVKESQLWAIRKIREQSSLKKERVALEIVSQLKRVPTVQAVFLTGSTAAKNAKEDADIDLMIITWPNTLWITRLLVFGWLKKQACPNIFLDLNHLGVTDRNLFTAHEILQAKCLYDRGGVEKRWLEANGWTREYLPQAYCSKMNNGQSAMGNQLLIGLLHILVPFELVAFFLQYLYMKPKMTNERVGWGYAFFHPIRLSEKVLKKLETRLLKYTHQ